MARSLTSTLDKLAASGKLDSFTSRKPSDTGDVISVELSRLEADPEQPRRTFDEAKLQSLSESIKARGVLQPITVQPMNPDGKHLIIMGERRWRAAQLAGLSAIPAMVRDATADLRAIQLTENVQRADLTTMEIAQAVEQMRKDGRKRSEIAAALGWGEAEVSRFARITTMPEVLRGLAQDNVPARALADLNALWKRNEAAALEFVKATPAADISRTTVAALRSEIEMGESEAPTDTKPQDKGELQSSSSPIPTDDGNQGAEKTTASSPTGPVAILCRHGEEIGRILTDRPASSSRALMVSFANGERIEEIALENIDLLEVVAL
ncbi:ParB/RepB/Spo0J family partition protein [Microbulbifer sp. S227A]|uniref:ParB/RepB/Spo0J family partition protein n=1 Tax=Microbulbifer sp. S227A TaxID=3415131 RepID=UPI003C7A43C6